MTPMKRKDAEDAPPEKKARSQDESPAAEYIPKQSLSTASMEKELRLVIKKLKEKTAELESVRKENDQLRANAASQEQEIEELNRSSIDDNSRNEDGSLGGGEGEESSEEEDEDAVDDNFDLLQPEESNEQYNRLLYQGVKIRAQWSDGKIYEATIMKQIDAISRYLFVHWTGGSKSQDSWIHLGDIVGVERND